MLERPRIWMFGPPPNLPVFCAIGDTRRTSLEEIAELRRLRFLQHVRRVNVGHRISERASLLARHGARDDDLIERLRRRREREVDDHLLSRRHRHRPPTRSVADPSCHGRVHARCDTRHPESPFLVGDRSVSRSFQLHRRAGYSRRRRRVGDSSGDASCLPALRTSRRCARHQREHGDETCCDERHRCFPRKARTSLV